MRLNLGLLVVISLALLLCSAPTAWADAPSAPEVVIYYSPSCAHCTEFLQNIWPEAQANLGKAVEATLVDVSTADGMAMLEADEARLGVRAPWVPVVVVGDKLIYDEDLTRLGERTVQAMREQTDSGASQSVSRSPTTAIESLPVASGNAPIHVAYVAKQGCSECDRASLILEAIIAEYPQVRVSRLDVVQDAALVEAMGAQIGLPEPERLIAPAIYVGNQVLLAEEITAASLRALLDQYVETGAPPFWQDLDVTAGQSSIVERFQGMGPLAVALAGLVDGVNPCAFATILFFVSYLAVSHHTQRRMLAVGLAFAAGVFVTYLLVGLGAMRLLELATRLSVIRPILYALLAAACLVLAGLSIRDYLLARRGRLQDMTLKLPDSLHENIRGRIRGTSGAFVGAAFATGAVVSLLELACTGQVYLPTILFVVGVPRLRASAIAYLLLYNLFFITPLLAVLLLAVRGTSAVRLQDWFVQNAARAKLLMSGVFVLLGGLLALQAAAII